MTYVYIVYILIKKCILIQYIFGPEIVSFNILIFNILYVKVSLEHLVHFSLEIRGKESDRIIETFCLEITLKTIECNC